MNDFFRLRRRIVFLIATMLTVSTPLAAQDASISGQVMQRGYFAVEGARVIYAHTATGLEFQTVTDDSGIYHFSGLPLSASVRSIRTNPHFSVATNSGGASHLIYLTEKDPITHVRVFDILGRTVSELPLISSRSGSAWECRCLWNGSDDHGVLVSNGMYFIAPVGRFPGTILRVLHYRGGPMADASPQILQVLRSRAAARYESRGPAALDETEYQVRIEPGDDGDRFLPSSFSRVLHAGDNGLTIDTVGWNTPHRVLFLGNSYTYFNNGLDTHVDAMIGEAHPEMQFSADRIAYGGYTFEDHFGNAEVCSAIVRGSYDMVVLQEQSTRPVDDPEAMFHYGALLDSIVRSAGAETAFFMTWAREWNQGMIEGLAASYNYLGDSLHAFVMPVGRAWQRCVADSHGIPLYDADGSHPSVHGTHLAACVFYAALLGESPLGLSYVCDPRIAAADRDYLQNLAWTIVREFGP